jgi:hypothetical protein
MTSKQRTSEGSTFSRFAISDADIIVGGRFAGQTPQHVVGSTPTPQYPAGPNWSQDRLPDEPPLGEALGGPPEPIGTPTEIANSLRDVSFDAEFSPTGSEQALPGDVRPASPQARAHSPLSKRKRR